VEFIPSGDAEQLIPLVRTVSPGRRNHFSEVIVNYSCTVIGSPQTEHFRRTPSESCITIPSNLLRHESHLKVTQIYFFDFSDFLRMIGNPATEKFRLPFTCFTFNQNGQEIVTLIMDKKLLP